MKRKSLGLGLFLSLTLAWPVAAGEAALPESFTLTRTLSILIVHDQSEGQPAPLEYGAVEPSWLTEEIGYVVYVNGGAESAWNLTVSGSDFTGPNDAMIPAEVRYARLSGPTVLAGGIRQILPEPLLVAHSDANSGSDMARINVSQWIDLGYVDNLPASGEYTGTTTWTVTAP